ncbi:hypothetical protein HDU67_009170 [Dinochytrium kinnereticum]|nr:hypothetical protein HDU67_009170 [Dinochytrium kinnereticum]
MEFLWPELLKQSPYSSWNDEEAIFYFVPQHSTCFYHKCVFERKLSTDVCKEETAGYLNAIVDHIQTSKSHWNISGGSDHLFVFSWDQASEVLGWSSSIRRKISPAIHLTTLGAQKRYENFDPHKDIVIPPYANFTNARDLFSNENALDLNALYDGTLELFNTALDSPLEAISQLLSNLHQATDVWTKMKPRGMFAYFRGTILQDYRYSFGVRQYLKELGKLYPEKYFILEGHSSEYWQELGNATFSLCPSGWSSWSPRLFDSMIAGAVPVIFADGIALPFENFVDYRSFAVKILNDNVSNLDSLLSMISEDSIRVKQRVLSRVKHHFVWNIPPKQGDAFFMTIEELKRKRNHKALGLAEFY